MEAATGIAAAAAAAVASPVEEATIAEMVTVAAAAMVPILVEVATVRRIARLMIVVEETKEEQLLRSEERVLLDLPAARVPVAAAGAKLHHRHPPRSCGSHPNRILLDVNIDGKSSL